jgi:hypothetical protein
MTWAVVLLVATMFLVLPPWRAAAQTAGQITSVTPPARLLEVRS